MRSTLKIAHQAAYEPEFCDICGHEHSTEWHIEDDDRIWREELIDRWIEQDIGAANDSEATPDEESDRGSNDGSARPFRFVETSRTVVDRWEREGPLVHERSGIRSLDELTGGGPIYGSRWYVNGVPDGGKTTLITQIADEFARRGIAVGVLAVDENADDIQTRLSQRAGWTRADCEERAPCDLAGMRVTFASLHPVPIRIYGHDHLIETAAKDLADHAAKLGLRAALFIDSVQSVRCADCEEDESERQTVTRNVRAIRYVATRFKLIVITTSEMNRGSYRFADVAASSQQVGDLASGKESGAIEYSARVMVVMRSVKDQPGLFECRIVKNKHGPAGALIYLRLDRASMQFVEADPPPQKPTTSERRKDRASQKADEKKRHDAEKAKAEQAQAAEDDAAVMMLVRAQPGFKKTELRLHVQACQGCGKGRADTAIARMQLHGRIRVEKGPTNNVQYIHPVDPPATPGATG